MVPRCLLTAAGNVGNVGVLAILNLTMMMPLLLQLHLPAARWRIAILVPCKAAMVHVPDAAI